MAPFSGYTIKSGMSDGDYVLVLDPASSSASKLARVAGLYLVRGDGSATKINGGGTINLNGYVLDITSTGEVDLGGFALSAAQDVDFGANALTLGGRVLTLTSSGNADFAGHKLTLTAGSILIDGVALPISDINGTIDLGGGTLSGDGNGTLTLDGDSITLADVIEGTAGSSNELAGFTASGVLQGAGIVRGSGAGVITLSSAATGATVFIEPAAISVDGNKLTLNANLTVSSDGTLDLSSKTLDLDQDLAVAGTGAVTINGGGAIDLAGGAIDLAGNLFTLGADLVVVRSGVLDVGEETLNLGQTLSVTGEGASTIYGPGSITFGGGTVNVNGKELSIIGGNVSIEGPGSLKLTSSAEIDGGAGVAGKLNLNSHVLTLTGTGTLDLGSSRTLSIDESINLDGGGTLNLDGFTATVAKTGTVAMLDDISAPEPSSFYAEVNFGLDYKWTDSGTGKVYPKSILFDPANYPAGATFKIQTISKKLVAGSATFSLYSGPVDTGSGSAVLGGTTVNYEAAGAYWSGAFTFTPPTEKRLFIVQAESSDTNGYELIAFQMVVTK